MTRLNPSGIPDEAAPESIPWTRYYQKIGVYPGWSVDRFNKACRLLGETPMELGHSCCVPASLVTGCIKKGRFPPHIALLFYMREQHFLQEKLGLENAT
jgi:hypothetical protein